MTERSYTPAASAMPAADLTIMAQALMQTLEEVGVEGGMSRATALGALGMAAAIVMAQAVPEWDEAEEAKGIEALRLGYATLLPVLRKAGAN